MKQLLCGVLLFIGGCTHSEHMVQAEMHLTTEEANQNSIGTVIFIDTPKGLQIDVDLKNLPAGAHGFHIHEYPDCGHVIDKNGNKEYGVRAGGHYDPDKTHQHLGPDNDGHRGDLPILQVGKDGTVQTHILVRSLTVAEIKNRSLMIHAGGDNYQDIPTPLGGGGIRIACGIIQ